jgi:hypothetical protein
MIIEISKYFVKQTNVISITIPHLDDGDIEILY